MTRQTSEKRNWKTRTLRIEDLEKRELLSVNPLEASAGLIPQSCVIQSALDYDSDPMTAESIGIELDMAITEMLAAQGQNPNALTEDFVLNLNSNPGSNHTIYLDFTGHMTTGTLWNNSSRPTITTPAYDVDGDASSFSNQELRNIYEVWLRVSEDYMPFDVNVTTKEPSIDMLTKSSSTDETFGVRVCIGGRATDWYVSSGTATGVSYVDVFDYDSDLPTFVFSGSCSTIQHIADSVSHETGHSLSLSHDGKGSDEYYFGGDGWGPIMGGAGYQELVQWSHGEYSGATNPQEDDLAKISSRIGYRADDHGDSVANATPLTFTTGEFGSGIIECNTDVDYFSFNLNGESAVIKVGGIKKVTNLDVKATVYNANGSVVGVYDPTDELYATVDVSNYSPGKYYLKVEGTGKSPVYSDYGSLGAYTIEATSRSIVVDTYEDVVDSTDDKISLREALTVYASDGDTITFASSLKGKTITLNPNLSQIYVNKNITIDASNLYTTSTATPGVTISGGDATRIMYLASGKAMTLKGLKFTHGKSPACGGAIWNFGALTVQDCVFADNNATYTYDDGSSGWYNGGAIAVKSGATIAANHCVFTGNVGVGVISFQTDASSTIEDCQFIDNGTYGIYLASGAANVNVKDSVLSGNTYGVYLRSDAGSIFVSDSELSSNQYYGVYLSGNGSIVVSNSELSSNQYYGVYLSGNGSIVVSNSELSSNQYGIYTYSETGSVEVSGSELSANQYGAYAYKGALSLVDSTVTNNTRGGIFCSQSGVVNATNVVISDNAASYYGGGVYINGKATLRNATITNNSAAYYGGGVYLTGSAVLDVYNSIIVGNTAQYGDVDVYKYGDNTKANAWNVLSSYTGWDSGAVQLTYDVDQPLFANASQRDYSLADVSQAINKGDNANVTTQTDIVGVARIFDGTVDLGAYEYGLALSPLTTPTITSTSSTSNSITVKWNVVSNATGYVVEYKSESDATFTPMSAVVTTTQTIPNLTPGTNYKIRVYALGDGTNYSNSVYSSVEDVKTQSVKLTEPTVTSTSSTTNSITVKWNAITNASGYVVAYKKSTDSSYTIMSSTNLTSRTIFNLSADTTYDVKVYAQGDGTVYTDSNYSAVKSVETQPANVAESPSTTVTTDEDVVDAYDGKISLREAMGSYSSAGDTIRFASAMNGKTITLDPDRGQFTVNKNITIDASSLSAGITLNGAGQTRIMSVYSSVSGLTITNVHFENGYVEGEGAAILFNGESLRLQNCAFTGNVSQTPGYWTIRGGAIHVGTGSLLAETCVFTNNSLLNESCPYSGGGAIGGESASSISVCDCSFEGNTTNKYGGAIRSYGAVTVDSSRFIENEAENSGGAIWDGKSVSVKSSTFIGNTASSYGGAIYAVGASSLEIESSTFIGNTASSYGGAIYAVGASSLEIENSLIARNTAIYGGGIELYGEATLRNSTVTNNVASSGGGGIDLDGSAVLNVYNSIITGNEARNGADVNKYSDNASANAWNVLSSYTAWNSGASQLTYDANQPLFTDAAQGDYSLAENSQAIDRGDNAHVTTQTDIVGNARIGGGTVDLGAYEYAVTSPTPLIAPTWKSTSSTSDSITVAWNAVSNASGYVVEYKGENDSTFTPTQATTSTSLTIPNLAPETTYKLRVYAVGDGVGYSDSGYSVVKTVKTKVASNPVVPLTAPTWKSTSSTSDSITVAWNAVSNASGYVVEYKGENDSTFTPTQATTSTSLTIPNLTPETTYKLRVYAVGDGVGYSDSGYSVVKTVKTKVASNPVVPLTAPTWKSSSSTSDSVTVTWNAVSNASGYVVEYKGENDSTFTPTQATTSTSLTIPNLASETTYKLRVYAVGDGVGYSDSGYSVVKTVKTKVAPTPIVQLAAPTWKSSSSTSDSVTVTWNTVINASGYVVEYKGENDSAFTPAQATTSTSLTIPNLASETTYKLRVYAVGDGVGYSDSGYGSIKAVKTKAASNPIVQLTAPTWKSSSSTSDSVMVAWNAVSNASGYVVEYKGENDSAFTPAQATTSTSLTISNLASETTYKFRVYAVGDGVGYSDSGYGSIKAVKTKVASNPIVQLTAPTWKSSSSTSDSVTVAWNAVNNASGYVVEYKGENDSVFTPAQATTSTSLTIPNLASETTYKFRVYAVGDGVGYTDSGYGSIKAVKTKVAPNPTVQLTAPTWKSSSSTSDSVTVSWNAVNNASGYVVEYKGENDSAFTPAQTTTSTSLTLSNLASETTYKFRVYAVGDGFNYSDSGYSSLKAVKTEAPVPLSDPTVTVASYDSSTRQATVTWDAISGAAAYKLQLSKNGGETWANYRTGLTTNTATVKGLYAGYSYAFRVYGVSDSGTTITTPYAEQAFAPILLTSSSDTYNTGSEIKVTQKAASNASATIRWYQVTPSGDVEITDALNKLTYTPTNGSYDVKVVATGTGDSTGSSSALVFANYSSIRIASYDSTTRQATLNWGEISGATSYKLQISKNGGEIWANYKTGLATTSATVNGLYVGKTYGFRVYGVTSSGATLASYYEKTFSPTNSSNSIVDRVFADFFEEGFFDV